MADGLTGPHDPALATEEGTAPARLPVGAVLSSAAASAARPATPHSEKFRAAMVLLVAIALAALAVAAAILVSGRSHSSGPRWSAWAPSDGGRLGETEIADHVAPFYRVTASQQLDIVTLMNLANPSSTGTATGGGGGLRVAVNQTGPRGTLSLLSGRTVAYDLCGTGGASCQLPGNPSAARLLLLRREALELALYTFKYIGGVDNVIAVLPPGHTDPTSTLSRTPPKPRAAPTAAPAVTVACLFVRQELQPWLAQPLGTILQPYPPPVAELPLWSRTEEAGLVDEITGRGLFSEKVEQAQDGSSLLVLNQLPTQ